MPTMTSLLPSAHAMTALLALAGVCAGLPACQTVASIPSITEPAWTGPKVDKLFKAEPEVCVRIHKGMTGLDVSGPAYVVVRQAGAGTVSADLMHTPVRISSGARGVIVQDAAGTKKEWGFGNDIEVVVNDGTAEGTVKAAGQSLSLNGTPYPGFATVRPAWSTNPTSFDVSVTMGIESYLPGVLTHELFKDWPRQTYEAQAIAARTYALHERYRARGEGRSFDVEDTDADQVFGGATKSLVANEAVRATRGLVLTDDGKLIRAYYSSTCGGRPASAKHTWPRKPGTEFNFAPSIQGEPREWACKDATFFRWTVTRDDVELSRRIKAWGKLYKNELTSMSRVREIKPDSSNDAGRPNAYRVTDDSGHSYVMTAEELRTASNWAVADAPPITRENRVSSGDFEVVTYANQLQFRGRGWGHGVGMCQWCAKGFADQGWDWQKMMTQFYPGAEVVKAY